MIQTKAETGQFWRNMVNRTQIVEILDIEKKNNKMVQSKVRFWAQLSPDKITLVSLEPKVIKVFSDEFRNWKLIDIDSF